MRREATRLTADEFRRLALSLPQSTEGGHQGHTDFRVGGKIFATLGEDEAWGMVKLPPEMQVELVETKPEVFEAFPGAWGRQGCTKVHLAAARKSVVRPALVAAWFARAPRRLASQYDEETL